MCDLDTQKSKFQQQLMEFKLPTASNDSEMRFRLLNQLCIEMLSSATPMSMNKDKRLIMSMLGRHLGVCGCRHEQLVPGKPASWATD